jgi:hypothetical protein
MVSPTSIYNRLPMLSQRRRRIAVLAAFGGYPSLLVGYSALVVPGRLSSTIWGPIAIALFSLTLVGVVAVYGYGRGRIDRSESLDERQRSMVDRALIVSYAVLTTVIVAIIGVVAFYASLVGPVVIEMTALSPWLIAIGLYIPFLPLAALAWLESDAPADDDDTPGS